MSQSNSRFRMVWKVSTRWVGGVVLIATIVAVFLHKQWLPHVQRLLSTESKTKSAVESSNRSTGKAHADGGNHNDDGREDHNKTVSIEISEQARKNINLQVDQVELQSFTKSISVPGMVVERPGRSVLEVTAPMTGIITRIYLIEGEAIASEQELFDLRLTHEELVQSQAEFLQTAEELEVTNREIERLTKLTEEGGLAGKQLLERNYEKQKQEAVLRSKRQALLLHGLTDEQVDHILERRELLKELTVLSPSNTEEGTTVTGVEYQVQSLKTAQGKHANAGDTLAILSNHAELYIEGEAFERDVADISRAADANADVSAVLESDGRPDLISGLQILYLAEKVNPDTRTLDFYVKLPNEKQRDTTVGGHRFVGWKFRPGQRVQLKIPIETLPDRIVLPIEAIAEDGVETYVFTPNGDHFERRTVHVEFNDTRSAVIANDGSLFSGDWVAITGAKQLQLAVNNNTRGGIDPHAGHNH